jgi:hypothetical protein
MTPVSEYGEAVDHATTSARNGCSAQTADPAKAAHAAPPIPRKTYTRRRTP